MIDANHSARLHVTVPAAAGRDYDVMIGAGLLDHAGAAVAAAAPAAMYAVVASTDVARLHGERVLRSLRSAGLHAQLITFPPGEAHKTRETWADLTDRMLALRFGRDSAIIALGGGVTGDVAGFVAATYMRGVPVIQVPTTLLAMIDASVGGKTGVDTSAGKNLVGAFHVPALVLADPIVLGTLPADQLRAGMAEAIKHGAILDEAYFEWLHAHAASLLALDAASISRLVSRSIELKAAVVAQDPLEHGRRAILNFGHTVGHAVELHHGYTMTHGFAVAVGMAAETRIGELAGVTQPGTWDRLTGVLDAFGLPIATGLPLLSLIDSMRIDKKARQSEPRFALINRIGCAAPAPDGGWTHAVDLERLRRVSASVNDV